jgi:uncharacterized membrane protein
MQWLRSDKALVCVMLMTALALLALWWWGWSLWTVLIAAVVLACPVIMFLAWLASRRAEADIRSAADALQRAEKRRRTRWRGT